jgi:undecaprenyl-diphosphatase
VLWIGLMQTLALIPGISRSGSTISAGRLCGWQWIDAALFSFILSIPTILGGMMLEILKADQSFTLPISYYVGGFLSSFVVGFFAVQFVIKIYEKEKVKPFAWYCLAIGLITWAIFHG